MKTLRQTANQFLCRASGGRKHTRILSAFAILLPVVICSCSSKPGRSDHLLSVTGSLSSGAPTNLICRAAQADRVIVTNRFAALPEEHRRFSVTIRGAELKRIVEALAQLRAGPANGGSANAACDWQLQFYRNARLLTTADFQGNVIRCDEGEYAEGTGVLDKLYGEVMKRTSPPEYPGAEK